MDSEYRKNIKEVSNFKFGYEKYRFLWMVLNDESNSKNIINQNKEQFQKFKPDEVFSKLWNLINKKVIGNNSRIRKHDEVSKNGKVFKLKNQIVSIKCNGCLDILDPHHFHRNRSYESGYENVCIVCKTRKRINRNPSRRGETYRNETIKKYNSVGNTIDRKCPKCKNFKSFKQFSHLYLGIGVCNDCYEIRNNSSLVNSKVEFFKGVQIRKYDDNSMVTHKKCSYCHEMKEIGEFHVNNNNRVDGRVNQCKPCNSEYQKSRTQTKNNSTGIP